jgi:hypothetical protein
MFTVMLGVTCCVAVVAIYFLWVRKLTAKAPEQAKTPDTRA